MNYLLKGANVYLGGSFVRRDVFVSGGRVVDLSEKDGAAVVIDCTGRYIFPGLVDVHVHLREPGFFYKEMVKTGTMAAARGGFTAICAMPNLKPVPDSLESLRAELDCIEKDAAVHVLPYGAITKGQQGEELAELEEMAPYVAGFSDDGKGVQSPDMMRRAMEKAKRLNRMIVAHCEENSLLNGGYIHDGDYAKAHGHRGIPSESEWRQIQRDVRLAKETGCAYHVCHVSAKESVDVIRRAKAEGVDITCETAPHYIALDDGDLQEDGRFKMNPPIRGKADREALVAGLLDGTIDMIVTDHAPHSEEEKAGGLKGSLNGIVGLETSFPVCYTELVKTGKMSLEKLLELMHDKPAVRFGCGTPLEIGQPADLTVFDLDAAYIVDPGEFLSMGKSSPFTGKTVYGKCEMTMVGGEIVWQAK